MYTTNLANVGVGGRGEGGISFIERNWLGSPQTGDMIPYFGGDPRTDFYTRFCNEVYVRI